MCKSAEHSFVRALFMQKKKLKKLEGCEGGRIAEGDVTVNPYLFQMPLGAALEGM